jgi:hypothetical protein
VRCCLLLLLSVACAPRALRVPGPLGPVGRTVRPLPERPDPVKPPAPQSPRDRRQEQDFREAIVASAEHFLKGSLGGYRDDCSGFASAVYDRVGISISGSVRTLWELASEQGTIHHRKHPELGDLVFFDDTFDKDRDGRVNDPLTHVAVVVGVADDGTITMAHGGTGVGRTTTWMNLEHPSERKGPEGEPWNNYLRRAKDSDPKGTKYLTGELWVGFATLRPTPDDRTASSR